MSAAGRDPVLAVEALTTTFVTPEGRFNAVDGLSLDLHADETVALVGESGCGKSVTALSIMRLLPEPARITGGAIRFAGRDLTRIPEPAMRRIRGEEIAMIFQEPMTSLNPVLTIGRQVAETVMLHRGCGRREAWERARAMLELVRIPDAARRLEDYPHQLSGGMRQRVMIAIALSCDPAVLIADEPTTALDVTVQAQIMRLMAELRDKLGTTILLITHNLGVVAAMCSRAVVMYAGRKVEEGPVAALYANPQHPYTRGLLASVPRLRQGGAGHGARLAEIAGSVPAPHERPAGCAFAPRCALALPRCREEPPALRELDGGHRAACWAIPA